MTSDTDDPIITTTMTELIFFLFFIFFLYVAYISLNPTEGPTPRHEPQSCFSESQANDGGRKQAGEIAAALDIVVKNDGIRFLKRRRGAGEVVPPLNSLSRLDEIDGLTISTPADIKSRSDRLYAEIMANKEFGAECKVYAIYKIEIDDAQRFVAVESELMSDFRVANPREFEEARRRLGRWE